MTDQTPTGVQRDEVGFYDPAGEPYNDANPVPTKTISSVLSTILAAILVAISAVGATAILILANQTNATQQTKITDGTNIANVVAYESDTSLQVAIGHKSVFGVHLNVDAASATVGYMLIDLSNGGVWPHTNTGHIVIENIIVQSSQTTSPAFLGDLLFGFLSNVDDTNGDFNQIGIMHGDRATPIGSGNFDFSLYGMDLESGEWMIPIDADDVTWQTDVNLLGPDGTTTHPSGDGDFVLKLASSAGTISFGVTVLYTTEE